jgi:hypothetical protein
MSALLTYFLPAVNFQNSLGHILTETQSHWAQFRVWQRPFRSWRRIVSTQRGGSGPEEDYGVHTF